MTKNTQDLMQKINKYSKLTKRKNWLIIETDNSFIKCFNSNEIQYNYGFLIEALQQENFQHKDLCKILETYYDQNVFLAYEVEKREGVLPTNYISTSKNPLKDFYEITNCLINFLDFANAKQMVLKDLSTPGNMLYNPITNQINIIDIDSIQIPNFSDNLLNQRIHNSIWRKYIINSPKYQSVKDQYIFTTELNYLLFYDFMFQSLFQESLIPQTLKDSIMIQMANFLHNPYPIFLALKEELSNYLKKKGLDPKSDLFARIMDLLSNNQPNSIALTDFTNLKENYTLNRTLHKLERI